MPASYAETALSISSPSATIPAREPQTAIVVEGGSILFGWSPCTRQNAVPLHQGEGWIVPAGTAISVYRLAGTPRIKQLDT